MRHSRHREYREKTQSEAEGNNDMGRQSNSGCSRSDANLCPNTQVLASVIALGWPSRRAEGKESARACPTVTP
jgi:hypothetical protein